MVKAESGGVNQPMVGPQLPWTKQKDCNWMYLVLYLKSLLLHSTLSVCMCICVYMGWGALPGEGSHAWKKIQAITIKL